MKTKIFGCFVTSSLPFVSLPIQIMESNLILKSAKSRLLVSGLSLLPLITFVGSTHAYVPTSGSDVGSFSSQIENNVQTGVMLAQLTPVRSGWQSRLPALRNKIIQELENQLKPLARGNRGEVKIEELKVQGANLFIKVKVHHKHKPSGLGIPYSLQTWAEISYNPMNPNSASNIRLCFKLPDIVGGGKVCESATNIIRTISFILA